MRCMCIRLFNEGRYFIFLMNVDYPRCWFHLLEVFIVVANGFSKMRVHLHNSTVTLPGRSGFFYYYRSFLKFNTIKSNQLLLNMALKIEA